MRLLGWQASGSWGQRLTGFTFWRHVEGELQRKVKAKQSFPGARLRLHGKELHFLSPPAGWLKFFTSQPKYTV